MTSLWSRVSYSFWPCSTRSVGSKARCNRKRLTNRIHRKKILTFLAAELLYYIGKEGGRYMDIDFLLLK